MEGRQSSPCRKKITWGFNRVPEELSDCAGGRGKKGVLRKEGKPAVLRRRGKNRRVACHAFVEVKAQRTEGPASTFNFLPARMPGWVQIQKGLTQPEGG